MKRLVYSPYVQAFVKADDGVIDVSPYITAGSVNRKINQVSSAELTLRNPVQGDSARLLFTEYSAHGDDPHPMFHPMDPIVIVLQRIAGHPVQVFTGYLDSSPYLQLYPGLCTLKASCTLKRLLYTQWDASLPAVQEFLQHFGWEPNGSGVWNLTSDSARLNTNQPSSQLTDGSIGALLFAVMNVIGAWDESTIWIEALPTQIMDIVTNLYQKIEPEVQAGESEFKSFLTEILGTASHGSGSARSGNGTAAQSGGGITTAAARNLTVNGAAMTASQVTVANTALDACARHNAGAVTTNAMIYAAMGEHDLSPDDTWQNSTSQSTATEAESWLLGGDGFQQGGGIACAQNNPSYSVWQVANAVEANADWDGYTSGVPAGSDSYALNAFNPSHGGVGQSGALAEAAAIVAAYNAAVSSSTGSGSSASNLPANADGASTAPADTVSLTDNTGDSTARLAGSSPGGSTGNPAAAGNTSAATNLAQVATIAKQGAARQAASGCFTYSESREGGRIPYDILTAAHITTDCSGYTIACYKLAGLPDPSHNNYNGSGYTGDLINQGKVIAEGDALPGDMCFYPATGTPSHVNIYIGNGQSVNMGSPGEPKIEATASAGPGGAAPAYFRSNVAGLPASAVSSTSSTTSGGTGSTMAAAFAAMINLPTALSQNEALVLTGKRSFIADSPLFPFVDQLAQASMRSYMSMPNGNFFAFFPDYFGFFGRQFYWDIRDIEILDGRIDLSDDPLLTHMGVAGDVLYQGEVTMTDLYLTAGIFDIFDAFTSGYVGEGTGTGGYGVISPNPVQTELTKESALAFLQRYGARPYVEEVPAIRSPYYELFLAFQNFMLAWSKQYASTFEFTFMPELFPGGLITLSDHHLQLYVEEVVHQFDYEQGFTTTATLSSPSKIPNDNKSRANLSSGLARPAALTSPTSTATSSGKSG